MDDTSAHTLEGVLTRLRAGGIRDPELASKLNRAFGKHIEGLRRYCTRELKLFPEPQIDEIVQDVLMEAWRKLPEYTPDASFRSFLFGIASKKCANARRKRSDALTEDGVLDPASSEATVLQGLVMADRDALVERAAANVLDPEERQIVYLRYALDYWPEEIAAQLERDLNEVRVALQRCKRRLEKEIVRLLAEGGHGPSFLG